MPLDCTLKRPLEICYLPKLEFPPCPEAIPLETYRAIIRSMKKKCVLKLQYVNADFEISERSVVPEALVWRDGFWYLAAFCLLRQERRTFRVDRMIHAQKSSEKHCRTGIGKEVKKYGLFCCWDQVDYQTAR